MLMRLYIEALMVDERMADQVWDAWNNGEIDDRLRYRSMLDDCWKGVES